MTQEEIIEIKRARAREWAREYRKTERYREIRERWMKSEKGQAYYASMKEKAKVLRRIKNPHGKHCSMTMQQLDKIAEMFAEGRRVVDIAKEVGENYQKIWQHVKFQLKKVPRNYVKKETIL